MKTALYSYMKKKKIVRILGNNLTELNVEVNKAIEKQKKNFKAINKILIGINYAKLTFI